MLTQCPNPNCKHVFDFPDELAGKNGPCPQCGQVITLRSLEIIRAIERQHQQRKDQPPRLPGSAAGKPDRFSALLEDLRSLWNVGSIFRSADGAGFGALYLCGITGCPPHKSIAKTSLGAEEHVAWSHHSNALDILQDLRAQKVQIIALEKTENSVLLSEALTKKLIHPPLCLIVGNEVAGVSAQALSRADLVCHLPMHGVKTSLNAAVAFGIAAYALRESSEV
ncbi:MAG TPA: TrmH family RNA methyltransferase [Planctomycetota bacterium]|nr:TrmH family RNA methyltransferase [Planctomycetota bacterium]